MSARQRTRQRRVPDADDLTFVRQANTGTVHIIAPDRPTVTGDGVDVLDFLIGTIRTRCGRAVHCNRGGLEEGGHQVDVFADEDLCAACHRTLPAEDRHRAFEHPTPADDPE